MIKKDRQAITGRGIMYIKLLLLPFYVYYKRYDFFKEIIGKFFLVRTKTFSLKANSISSITIYLSN